MIQLIINDDLMFDLKSFDFRICPNDNENGISRFQKIITCDFGEIENIEEIFSQLVENFSNNITIQVKDNSFEFEGYELGETSLYANMFGELNVNIVFRKDFL